MRNKKTRSIPVITGWFLICAAGVYFIFKKPVNTWLSKKNSQNNKTVTITETFFTEKNSNNNIDSLAVWHSPTGQHWVVTTAKKTHKLFVYDAATGNKIKDFGTFGKSLMQFARPNGIAIIDNLVFVVERDNHRIQAFTLPEFTCVGCAGEENLIRPYGISIYKTKPDTYIAYITDNYKTEAPDHLNQRIHKYEITYNNRLIKSKLITAFGSEKEKDPFYKVESIVADPENNRLFIAEEKKGNQAIKIYNLQGEFTGQFLGKDLFLYEPEGIALYTTGQSTGYIVATDQSIQDNTFHVFDRQTLQYCGAFKGSQTSNTDGIALTPITFGSFAKGAFYAINNDSNIAAIAWSEIEHTLNLK
ncbi:MAG: phytase [bacterium]